MNPRSDKSRKRSNDPEWELIDRHLAGLLTPSEEAELEELIRSSSTWAHRYREAEEMARLLHKTLGPSKAPDRVKAAIRRVPMRERESREPRRVGIQGRVLATAACLLVAITAGYLFWPGEDGGGINKVAAGTIAIPLKDLARASEIGVIGEVVSHSGQLGLRITKTLFGDAGGRTFDLPPTARPGQRLALFGSPDAQGVVRIVKGGQGLIRLDARVEWEEREHDPAETEALVLQASDLRTLQRCLDDLRAFLRAPASTRCVNPRDGLSLSAEDTVRFMGTRFDADRIRSVLSQLMKRPDKHVDVRNACGESLMRVEPLASCERFLKHINSRHAALLRAESEDGYVVLQCLRLIQAQGASEDLVPELERLAARVECPAMKRTAEDTARAARGEGKAAPISLDGLRRPQRLVRGEQEAIVMAGCDGHMDRLLVIFRPTENLQRELQDIRMAMNLAVAQGIGVLVLPPGAGTLEPWLHDAKQTGLVDDRHVTFLGLGEASTDAVRAALDQTSGPARLVLLGKGLASRKWKRIAGTDCIVYDSGLEADSARGPWKLRQAVKKEQRAQNPSFWTRVLER